MSEPTRPMIPEELLQHAPWVRRLAWQLLRDADLVDDALQHTWMAALRSPPTKNEKIRAWFRAVVNNFARDNYRNESARHDRERLVARAEAVPAADEVYDRALCQREVVSAVLALDEPSRTVLLLRYFDDLPPRKIAAKLGVPVETVRTRLKRALPRLRERLAADAGRDGRDWTAMILPLVAVPAGTNGPAHAQGGSMARRLMPRWSLVAGAAIVVVGIVAAMHVVTPALREAGPPRSSLSVERSSVSRPKAARAAPASSGRPGAVEPVAASVPASTADPTATSPAAARAEVHGRLDLDVPTAAFPVTLHVVPITADARATLAPRTCAVAAGEFRGAFELWGAPTADIVALDIVPDHPDFVPMRTRVPWRADASKGPIEIPPLALRRAAIVTGVIAKGTSDAPVVVTAFLRRGPDAPFELIDRCPSGAGGAFRLRLEPAGEHLLVALAAGRPPASRWVHGTPLAETNVGTLLLEPGVACSGRLTAAPEISIDGAVLQVNARASGRSLPYPGETLVLEGDSLVMRRFSRVRLGAGGEFAIEGLAPGPYTVGLAVRGLAGDLQQALVQDVVLPRAPIAIALGGAVADLEVAGPYGPIDGAKVTIRDGAPAAAPSRTANAASTNPPTPSASPTVMVRTGSDGHARLIGVPGHSYALSIEGPGYEVSAVEIAFDAADSVSATRRARTERVDLRPLPTDATWSVAIEVDPNHAPQRAAVAFFKSGSQVSSTPLFVRNVEIADGALRVAGIPAGSYLVVVRFGTTWEASSGFFADAVSTVEFAPGASASGTVSLVRGGRLRLAARSEDGVGLAALVRLRDPEGSRVAIWLTHREVGQRYDSPDELTAVGPVEASSALAPGVYTVEFALSGYRSVRREVHIEAGAVADVAETLLRE